MADPNKEDPEVELRVRAMVRQLMTATEGRPKREARLAFSNAIALLCPATGAEDPEAEFLALQIDNIEVFAAMREHVRAGKDPRESLN